MIVPAVFDWPLPFWRGIFFAGGQAIDGGFTSAGVQVLSPEPGGRAYMDVAFRTMAECDTLAAAWVASIGRNGAVWRVPVFNSTQLVSPAALGVDAAWDTLGVPWAHDQPWSNGLGWAFEPSAAVSAPAPDGAISVTVDTAGLGRVIERGHVVGFRSGEKVSAHHVDLIDYSGAAATLTISPPLRFDVAADARMSLRPKMLATIRDADGFRAMFERGRHRGEYMTPGNATFVEAIL